jgi:hypothetical protein
LQQVRREDRIGSQMKELLIFVAFCVISTLSWGLAQYLFHEELAQVAFAAASLYLLAYYSQKLEIK